MELVKASSNKCERMGAFSERGMFGEEVVVGFFKVLSQRSRGGTG